ncbi:ASCH domain-containing protein [Micromonospora sp. HNM0581]|uniref:ASCH domain-containing protein n=1 Tax=Micromonospora sp. HNM0581 TaxID=2716341 RepID=UPI00321718B3
MLEGVKTATAGLLDDYTDEGEALEHVGERLVLVDDDDAFVAVVQVTGVKVTRFAEVPSDFGRRPGHLSRLAPLRLSGAAPAGGGWQPPPGPPRHRQTSCSPVASA